MHILVIDDKEPVRTLISRRLASLGHEVAVAADGAAGEAELNDGTDIDLVITDICLPGRNGIALLRLAKQLRPDIEVIVMTAYAEVESAASAVDADAFAYLRKPFCLEELVNVVERAAQHIEMRRERAAQRARLEELVKKLEASERRYRMLVEGIGGAVISTDEDLVILSASQRCTKMLGRTPEQLIGTSIDALRPEEDAADFRERARALLEQGTGVVRLDGRLLQPDGGELYTIEVAVPLHNELAPGTPKGICWIVEDATAMHKLRVEAELARDYLDAVRRSRSEGKRIVGESHAIKSVLRMIKSIAGSVATVLVRGETGTGKELVAESIHINSGRAKKPFVVLNCAALQETLLESELFGHKRGAFTGAVTDKRGLLEIADGGTVFIDEIAEMVPAVQAKVLRVLEQGEFRRLGGTTDRRTDIRVVAATNRDLAEEVKRGRFREDLLYRLDVIRVDLPPLRERMEDIPLIAEHLLRHSGLGTMKTKQLSPAVLKALMAYDWPGNVRELSNVIERAAVLSGASGTIGVEHLSIVTDEGRSPVRTLQELRDVEIDKALGVTGGNKTRAAAMLGITRQTLISQLKRRATENQSRPLVGLASDR